jgi:hypothetical protein
MISIGYLGASASYPRGAVNRIGRIAQGFVYPMDLQFWR